MNQERFNLSQVISPQLITLDTDATNKEEVLTELAELLYKNEKINDKEGFLKDVYLREKEGTTGIGQGVAIPHGKSKTVKKTSIAIGITRNLIEWESLDGEGVSVIILFAVQDTEVNTTHILMLQQVAIMLADDDFIANLKNVKRVDELIRLIKEFAYA